MNLPNIFTFSRFFLIPLFVLVFFQGYELLAFGVFIIAGITDVIDGYLARKYKMVTELGGMLDPLADKLMVLTVFISLLIAEKISWLVAAAVFLREAGMIVSSIIFHIRGKSPVPANILGKLTTLLFYLAILLITFQLPYNIEFLWFVISFSFLTSIIYMFEFKKMYEEDSHANTETKSGKKTLIDSPSIVDEYRKGAAAGSK